jgi:hypothetical protein
VRIAANKGNSRHMAARIRHPDGAVLATAFGFMRKNMNNTKQLTLSDFAYGQEVRKPVFHPSPQSSPLKGRGDFLTDGTVRPTRFDQNLAGSEKLE